MSRTAPPTRLFHFVAGGVGDWHIDYVLPVIGPTLVPAARLHIAVDAIGAVVAASPAAWALRGITSNDRYVTRPEKTALVSTQAGLGRAQATRAALIPIRKTPAWWALTQDERREVLEAQSQHIAIGMQYLPAIARRLHHCRDLGADEAFDFLTWFEYQPSDEAAFDELLRRLRASPEWAFVEREVDVRVSRVG